MYTLIPAGCGGPGRGPRRTSSRPPSPWPSAPRCGFQGSCQTRNSNNNYYAVNKITYITRTTTTTNNNNSNNNKHLSLSIYIYIYIHMYIYIYIYTYK